MFSAWYSYDFDVLYDVNGSPIERVQNGMAVCRWSILSGDYVRYWRGWMFPL